MDTARTDGTWLLTRDAAKAGGVTDKALRRRIERGTVVSELREDGRRYVLVDSITEEPPRPAPRGRGPELAPLVERLEQLAAEAATLRALSKVAESTEQRLRDELVQQHARVVELEAREAQLAGAGPFRAWRLARQLRRPPAG